MTLARNSTGSRVEALQRALEAAGFDPGPFDGFFDADTEHAVRDFQAAHALTVDGVAGPITLVALGLALPAAADGLTDITARVTPPMVDRLFPGTPLGNIARNLPYVLAALAVAGIGDRAMVLMALATIRAECAPFEPLVEGESRWNTRDEPFDVYDNDISLGNGPRPDGPNFRGRGFVQLTGRYNYAKFGPRLGVDLVAHPDLACEPAIAATLLALFLRDAEAKIRAALAAGDLRTARKLVNGGTHGLADFTDAWTRGQNAIPAALAASP